MQRHLVATAELRAPLSVVEEILRNNPDRVLSDRHRRDKVPGRTIRTSLTARFGSGAAAVQDVTIELGMLRGDEGSMSAPLRWTPVGNARLLPEFVGELSVTDSGVARRQLTISGGYEAPLGLVGRLGDAVLGRRVGRRTLTALVEVLARRVDEEAERQRRSTPHRRAPYNEDLSGRRGHHAD